MAISIYREYTTDQLILGLPCKIKNIGSLYPVKVKDWFEFSEYGKYLTLSYKHLKLEKKEDLLLVIFQMLISENCKDYETDEEALIKIDECIHGLERMFSIIFRMDIKYNNNPSDIKFLGYDEEGNIIAEVNRNNYEMFRIVSMKLNCMQEELIFEDALTEKWYRKAQIAERKGKKENTLGDIILTVSQNMGFSMEYIQGMAMFLLYAYYHRIIHVETCRTLDIYRCAGASKIPNTNITDPVIQDLFKVKTLDDYLQSEKGLI